MKAPTRAVDFQPLSVLVVDDMANMRRTMKNMLRYIGFDKITEAADGQKALDQLSSRNFDLIICDWNMPSMHGLDLLRKVRAMDQNRFIPFVMVTAEISQEKIVQAAEEAVDGYLLKPFVAKQLEEKIKSVLKHRAEPTPFEKHMRTAEMLAEAGSFDVAIEEYAKGLKLKPDSARVRLEMARIHHQRGDNKEAERLLDQALELNPKFTRAYELMSDIQQAMGNGDQALEFLEKAGNISPNNPERQVKLGKLYIEKGETDKADTAFHAALENSAHDANIHTDIGEVYLASGQDDKAATAFLSSIDVVEDVHVYNRLGIALRKKGAYKEAEKVYRKALELEPHNEGVRYNFARLYSSLGRNHEAMKELEKALEISPDFSEAKTLLKQLKQDGR